MDRTELIHRTTKEKVSGYQYVQGGHPPPPGVRVTMGLGGVVARANTAHGSDSVILDGDWLLTMKNGGIEIFTDTFVHGQYRRVDEEDTPAKPVKLG